MAYLIVGLGSMGCRRLRLLKKSAPDLEIVGVDQRLDRRQRVEKDFQVVAFSSIEGALQKVQVTKALICTSPLSHAQIIRECLGYGLDIFTELNLVDDGYPELISLAESKGLQLFLSSTTLYRKEVEYIQSRVRDTKRPCFYRYHVGQYLPDWHPWEGYKEFFVGDKRTNGCREIFGIEMPWIIDTFGKVTDVKVNKAQVSTLDIDFPDTFIVQLTHESGHFGVFLVDVVARHYIRNLEIVSEDLQLRWEHAGEVEDLDISKQEFNTISMAEKYGDPKFDAAGIAEAAYRLELDVFRGVAEGEEPRYGFVEDQYTLSVIDQIEGIPSSH